MLQEDDESPEKVGGKRERERLLFSVFSFLSLFPPLSLPLSHTLFIYLLLIFAYTCLQAMGERGMNMNAGSARMRAQYSKQKMSQMSAPLGFTEKHGARPHTLSQHTRVYTGV